MIVLKNKLFIQWEHTKVVHDFCVIIITKHFWLLQCIGHQTKFGWTSFWRSWIKYLSIQNVTFIFYWTVSFQSQKQQSKCLFDCSFVSLSVLKQNYSTAWNHHPSSFIFQPSSFFSHTSFILLNSSFLHFATFKLFSLFYFEPSP